MKRILLSVAFLAFSLHAAQDLIDMAKAAGLKPIPASQAELMKVIEQKDNPLTPEKIQLGKKLYFDPRLSKSGIISCNTCHNLGLGGVDGVPTSVGHRWEPNPHHLNSPTVYNSVFNSVQFWDGRSPHLADQAMGPIQAIPEMALSAETAVARIGSIPAYVKEFERSFSGKDPVTFENIGKAIAAFEATLVTPSRYDDFLNGDTRALSKAEQEGLRTFIEKGCAACHNGIGTGGATMEAFAWEGQYEYADIGDFSGNEDGLVRTPTLRNITETAPYFHNGTVWDLHEAVEIMANIQLGMELTQGEIGSIVTFLEALEGRKPEVVYPMLPASTADTPRPQPFYEHQ